MTSSFMAPGPRLSSFLLLLAVMIALGFAITKLPRSEAAQNEVSTRTAARPLAVLAEPVVLEEGFETLRRFPGEIRTARETVLGFERSDRLVELFVSEGSRVLAGELLARLDTRNLEARRGAQEAQLAAEGARLSELEAGPRLETIAAARARVVELEQRLELALLVEERRAELAADRHASQEEADRARLEARASEAQLDSAREVLRELENGTRAEVQASQRARIQSLEAELAVIDADLAKSRLEAPFDGVVAELFVEAGGVIAPGQSALRLLEANALEAWVGVPPRTLERLRGGLEATLEGPGGPLNATLGAALPELDPATRMRTAIFELEGQDLDSLANGELVELVVADRVAERGAWVPLAGLVRSRRGLWAAYVLNPGSEGRYTVAARELELVHTAGDRAYLRGPLAQGELLLVAGAHRVVPGQEVVLAEGARP